MLHVDMDAFFASVEALDEPSLRGIPLVVGGTGRRGVVSSCSYEARFFGVRSAMPIVRARQLCPQATFVSGNFSRYEYLAERFHEILLSYTPRVEPLSLDEAFLDVSGSQKLFGSGQEIAWKIRQRIQDELGLTVSVGVASSKHVAKLASREAKPQASRSGPINARGVVEIRENEAVEFLHRLRVGQLWGVGPATEKKLQDLGIATVKQLSVAPIEVLERHLGNAAAKRLLDLAWNRDEREVVTGQPAQSIGCEQTFERDLVHPDEIRAHLLALSQKVARKLRREGMEGRTVEVKVRFGDFATVSRSVTHRIPTDHTQEIFQTARELASQVYFDATVRLLGISVSNLSPPSADAVGAALGVRIAQPSLFDHELAEKDAVFGQDLSPAAELDRTLDGIADRFGEHMIISGRQVGNYAKDLK